jgi:hypothetical protein
MDRFERIWKLMTQSERIVAMSLVVGGIIGITNSTVWAVATCYIANQRTRARLAQIQDQSLRRLDESVLRAYQGDDALDLPDLPDDDPFHDDVDDEAFPPDSLTVDKM